MCRTLEEKINAMNAFKLKELQAEPIMPDINGGINMFPDHKEDMRSAYLESEQKAATLQQIIKDQNTVIKHLIKVMKTESDIDIDKLYFEYLSVFNFIKAMD